MYEQILFEQRDRVAVITLNRPERLNAWTWQMGAEISDAVRRCNDDASVGAIVVTGAGRGFCSGADIQGFNRAIEQREATDDEDEKRRASGPPGRRESYAQFFPASKPIIAAINGPSIGVGLTLTLPMDLRIASDQARFSMRFVRMGITPEVASTVYLPQIVGLANALEMVLTGRIIGADDALRIGLVQKVVPAGQLMDEALALAGEIAHNPTDAAMSAKRLVHRNMVDNDMQAVVERENAAIYAAYQSPNHKEAIRAFIEKRQPIFNQP